jgi:hypothetical protein
MHPAKDGEEGAVYAYLRSESLAGGGRDFQDPPHDPHINRINDLQRIAKVSS